MLSSLFADVLGVKTTTYYWGFRGAEPAEYYPTDPTGADYSVHDFVRLQLFRDVHVYEEIGRRAALVCADPATNSVDGHLTINEWISKRISVLSEGRRALKDSEPLDHSAHVRAIAPRLPEHQLEYLAKQMADDAAVNVAVEQHCAPAYTTDCLMKHTKSLEAVKPARKKSRSLRMLA